MLQVVERCTRDAKCYRNHVIRNRHSFVDYLAVHSVNKAFLDPIKVKRLQVAAEPC